MMILGIFDNDVAAMMVCKRPCLAVMRLCSDSLDEGKGPSYS